jgi:phosphatidylglycerol:prolipoprotein diacylglycerol transferase
MNAFILSALFLWLARKERPTGTYIVVFALWYGVARFFLDFLRVVDVRYAGLTPGQYFSLILIIFGTAMALWITDRAKKRKGR